MDRAETEIIFQALKPKPGGTFRELRGLTTSLCQRSEAVGELTLQRSGDEMEDEALIRLCKDSLNGFGGFTIP